MAILHQINHREAFQRCQALVNKEDGIVLFEDAVLLLAENSKHFFNSDFQLYVLKADLDARAIKAIPEVVAIDYDEWVELTLKFDKTISW